MISKQDITLGLEKRPLTAHGTALPEHPFTREREPPRGKMAAQLGWRRRANETLARRARRRGAARPAVPSRKAILSSQRQIIQFRTTGEKRGGLNGRGPLGANGAAVKTTHREKIVLMFL